MHASSRIVIACVMPLTFAAASIAAPNGPAAGAPPPDQQQPAPGRDRPMPPLPGDRVDAEIAYMRTALKITDAESAAWNRVADVLRDHAKRMDAEITARRARTPDAVPPDLLARLEEHRQNAASEADESAKLLAAVRPLYAMLTPEQKQVADTLPFGPPGPMGPRGPMGPPGPGRGGPMPPPDRP